MSLPDVTQERPRSAIPKSPTGISGLDEITGGGLPTGRPTLICGGPGCGKTVLATEFLVRGAAQYGEPGVFMAFEETAEELKENTRSLGFGLDELVKSNRLRIDHVHVDRNEIEETGEYDLEGLFVRLNYAIESVGAKRVVLDTLESLYSGLQNSAILRAELRRLFRWLKGRGVTAIITAERGADDLTKHGLEEYVSDCVIVLDHRVVRQNSIRRLRIIKYRGSMHGTNEYPYLIDGDGITVMPLTAARLEHEAPLERVSTGIAELDGMLGGRGYYRGSSVLISGTAGTGKTTIAAHFADASCRRGQRSIFFAFEESPSQLIRNMRSVGLDLQPWLDSKLLQVHSFRPSSYGLEMHLTVLHKLVTEFKAETVVVDPISNFVASGTSTEAGEMLTRLIDHLKRNQITAVLTTLTPGGTPLEGCDVGISSIIDTWLLVREIEQSGQRKRGIYVVKSRGMPHSNEVREFKMAEDGLKIGEVYRGLPAQVQASGGKAPCENS